MMAYIKQNGDRKFFSFGQRRDPCLGLFSKIMSTWRAMRAKPEDKVIENLNVAVHPNLPGLDPGNTSIIPIKPPPSSSTSSTAGGHRAALPRNLWVTTDNSTLKQIDPETLEPIGFAAQTALHPDLIGPTSCAHAQRDPITGDIFNFNLQFGRESTYRIFRVSAATGKTDILAAIRGPDVAPAYIHSFFLSSSFVILCVPSSHLGFRGMRVVWERNLLDAIEPFDKSKKCKWYVVDRLHGRGLVAQFETDAGFFFHSVNAFEERDEQDLESGTTSIISDIIEYPNFEVMYSLYYDVLLDKNGAGKTFWSDERRAKDTLPTLARYRLRVPFVQEGEPEPKSGLAAAEKDSLLSDTIDFSISRLFGIPNPHCGELPTINPRFATRRYRYVYSLALLGTSKLGDGIVKTDMDTKEVVFANVPVGHSPGEAIFVPRPDGTEEDDGVLLSVVLDGERKTSYLLCLDARDMTELGRAEIGFAIGLGFHGAHVTG